MRTPTDMPRRRKISSRGRILIIVAVAVVFVLVTSLRGLAGFWTDFLWFDSLGLSSVFTGVLGARVALGAIFTLTFFVLLFVSLTVADRLAPKVSDFGPDEELLNRYQAVMDRRAVLVRLAVSFAFGLIAGVGMSGGWNQWILFRNGGSFGTRDATFDTDVGFYVFKLPFYTSVVNWLFASGVVILLITIVAHYLNGGIRIQTDKNRVTPQVKAHISVILGLLALVKAADYWLQRYALTYSTRGTVDGALYTEVNAQLPAIYLLLFIALLSFLLFLVNIRRRGWTLPVVAVGLWALVSLVAGVIYPAFIQRFVVEPEESTREQTYITNNIDATREAMGLADVESVPFAYSQDKAVATRNIDQNPATIRNIRLLDPAILNPTFQRLQSQSAPYRFNDLDVDRYPITTNGATSMTQVIIGTRGINVADIPQQSWEGRHLAYTHGYGVALAPANATTTQGRPEFLIRDVPLVIDRPRIDVSIEQPQIYYGENVTGYAITNAGRAEVDYVEADGTRRDTTYSGEGGVGIGSFFRKAAFGLRFADWNLLVSNYIEPQSRIVFQRDVRERIEAVAPFIRFDADPYPVIHDNRIVYIFDGYTTTDRYPNAQRADASGLPNGSGLGGARFNYIRNSVKGVVDSFDGTVTLYIADPEDPIVNAYAKAFPDLFDPLSEMDEQLRDHWRYPEDLFRVQTNMYGRYHITDPTGFYERTSAWSVAQDPSSVGGQATVTSTSVLPSGQTTIRLREARIEPKYMYMRLPGETAESFVMLRPFVPFSEDDSKKTLTSFMVASSDPDDYGKITVYEMPGGTNIDGPSIVGANIAATPEVSQRITLLNQQGSRATYGSLMLVPVENSIVYVRPLYVSSDSSTQVPELKQVIAVFGGEVVMRPTLREALQVLFPGANPETFESSLIDQTIPVPVDPGSGATPAPSTTTTTVPPAPPGDASKDDLINRAALALADAELALRNGDLALYQAKVREAQSLLEQAQRLSVTPTTSPPVASSSGTPVSWLRSG